MRYRAHIKRLEKLLQHNPCLQEVAAYFFSTLAPDPLLMEHSTRIKAHTVLTPFFEAYLKKYGGETSTMKLCLMKTQDTHFVHGFLHSKAIPSSTVVYFEKSKVGLFLHPSIHEQKKMHFYRFWT